MSDPAQRRAEGEAAKAAFEQFIAPALSVLRADYMKKLVEHAVQPMEGRALQVVQNMSLALRIADEVEGQIKALILDGEVARQDLDRAGRLSRMGPEERRYAEY